MQKNETQRLKPVLLPRFFSILKYYIKTPFKSCLTIPRHVVEGRTFHTLS